LLIRPANCAAWGEGFVYKISSVRKGTVLDRGMLEETSTSPRSGSKGASVKLFAQHVLSFGKQRYQTCSGKRKNSHVRAFQACRRSIQVLAAMSSGDAPVKSRTVGRAPAAISTAAHSTWPLAAA
jgi:hypothetical protein